MRVLLLSALCVAACEPAEVEDGIDDAFEIADGKADSGGIADGTPPAIGALRLVNGASAQSLKNDVRVTKRVADNIVAWRRGADGVEGTADDRIFYALAELDAIPYIGPATLSRIVDYATLHPELFGPRLTVGALPAELAEDALLVEAMAADPSLGLDGDQRTLTANEWERGLLYAHHFAFTAGPRIAALRTAFPAAPPAGGPFVDLATIPRAFFGAGNLSWAIDDLLVRVAADPRHVPGRISAAELAAAGNGAWWADRDFVAVWNAQVTPSDPGDLPPERAQVRDLLTSFGAPVFTGPYPPEREIPGAVESTSLRLPFLPGTDVLCLQGNNTMTDPASHGPHTLRYSVDFGALGGTPITAAAPGVAYVYDGGREGKMDNWAFGNLLLIDLGNGYALLYAHAQSFTVRTGEVVAAGQVVALMGKTGPAGPHPHLHMEVVRLYRQPDPAHEIHQADSFEGPFPEAPFGTSERFHIPAIDVTAGEVAPRRFDSTELTCAEGGWLLGAGHVYRAP
jgi:hypothetical protein